MESEKKIGIDDFICKVEIKTQRTNVWIPRRRGGVGELGNWVYTDTIMYKIDI